MRDGSAYNKPGARRSAATSCHRGRRDRRHEDLRAHGGRRYCSSSDAWGQLFCRPGWSRHDVFYQLRWKLHRTSSTPLFRGECSGRQSRCGPQIVSLILGDALTISLYSYEDHFQPATSSVLLDRGGGSKDELEDSDSMRLVWQQILACYPFLPDGHGDKFRRK